MEDQVSLCSSEDARNRRSQGAGKLRRKQTVQSVQVQAETERYSASVMSLHFTLFNDNS